MSLNSISGPTADNNRNLVEMKNQKKYAQLVEAQSPEPQTATGDEDEAVGIPLVVVAAQDKIGSVESVKSRHSSYRSPEAGSGSSATAGVPPEVEKLTSTSSNNFLENPLAPDSSLSATKLAASNSKLQLEADQPSVDQQDRDVSAASQGSRRSCSGDSLMSTCFVSTTDSDHPQSAPKPTNGQQKQHNHLNHQNKHRIATNLNGTISQSMLQLDQSIRLDNFEVSWRNLSFTYGTKWSKVLNQRYTQKQPLVLNNLSGRFQSNQLVAIIGPSGCGKTTLLQFLAGNNPIHRDRLRILGLDEPKVAFIGQDDCLLPGLTVKETLIYASKLQNSRPGFDHHQHIMPIVEGLGLAECANRSVTKLSGGQTKRVTIAQELLYPTNLLILDEVTSGLDASTSYSIIKLLKKLVSDKRYPMSIVMSIHQPSARLFAVFDQVYVMSEGSCIYEGSCEIDVVNTYLGRFGLECPKFHNIADYLIEIASENMAADDVADVRQQMISYRQKRGQWQEGDRRLDLASVCTLDHAEDEHQMEVALTTSTNNDPDFEVPEEQIRLNGYNGETGSQKSQAAYMSNSLYEAVEKARHTRERPIYKQFFTHFTRSLLRIRRSYILTYLQLITYILLGLQLSTFYGTDIGTLSGCPQLPMGFLAFVFSNETPDGNALEMRRIQENMNFLLVTIMTATFAALEITVITFPLEAKTVKREWRNGWYRVTSYFMGRTLADLPFQLAFVIVFCLVIYTLTGQIGLLSWRFGSFIMIIVMTAMVAQTVGFIFGALFMDNLPAAVFTAPLCIFPALLFSGFFSRVSQIPSFYRPLTFLSHFRYAFDAIIVTLYGYDRCNCDQAILTSYHESQKNQTVTIKDMFKSLFGAVDCTPPSPDENSIEDILVHNDPLNMILNNQTMATTGIQNATTTVQPRLIQTIKPIEDALVESVFEHMSNSSEPPEFKGDAMDRLTQKFSTRITTMFNSQANFGHEIPATCQNFNSYLMTEFDLHNDDLMFGLFMLFVFVIITRLLCNIILTFTIARRTS